MRKLLLYLLISSASFLTLKAQSAKYFNTMDSRDSARITYIKVENLSDGYVASGFYEYIVPGQSLLNCYGYIVKYDLYGNLKWRRLLQRGDSLISYTGLSVINNFIYSTNTVGTNNSNYGYCILVKMNGITGDTVWVKEYKTLPLNLGSSLVYQQHLIYSQSYAPNPTQIITIDTNGVIIQNKQLNDIDNAGALIPLNNGKGYLMSCFKNNKASVARLSLNFDTVWTKQYAFAGINSCPYIANNIDTTQFLLFPSAGDSTIGSIDENGNLIWKFALKKRSGFFDAVPTEDGGFTMAGGSSTSDSTVKPALLRLSASGDSIWFRQYFPQPEVSDTLPIVSAWWGIKETPDMGYISVGMYHNLKKGYLSDGWISKVDCMGNDSINIIPTPMTSCRLNVSVRFEPQKAMELSIFPNPSNGVLQIKPNSPIRDVLIELYNVLSSKMYEERISELNGLKVLNMQGLSKGLYLVKVTSSENTFTQKIFLK